MKMVLSMQKACYTDKVQVKTRDDGLEIKSGSLYMVQACCGKSVKIPMYIRVYQNSFEHYAIINRDVKYTNSSFYISLKHCKVYRSDSSGNEFKVVPHDIEGTALTFQVGKEQDIDDWIAALQPVVTSSSPPKGSLPSPKGRRTPLMPTLQESIEEEDSEFEEDGES